MDSMPSVSSRGSSFAPPLPALRQSTSSTPPSATIAAPNCHAVALRVRALLAADKETRSVLIKRGRRAADLAAGGEGGEVELGRGDDDVRARRLARDGGRRALRILLEVGPRRDDDGVAAAGEEPRDVAVHTRAGRVSGAVAQRAQKSRAEENLGAHKPMPPLEPVIRARLPAPGTCSAGHDSIAASQKRGGGPPQSSCIFAS